MQPLDVRTVDQYTVEKFPEEKFCHHFEWKGTLYKAGHFFRDFASVDPDEEPDLHYSWASLNHYMNEELPEAIRRVEELEAEFEAKRLAYRQTGEKTIKRLKANPTNPDAYYALLAAQCLQMEHDAQATELMAIVSKNRSLRSSVVGWMQIALRTNLPIALIDMQDQNTGVSQAVAFVWHCPKDPEGKFDPDRCNPNAIRDFPTNVRDMVGKEEFIKLWNQYGPKKNMVQAYSESDEKFLTGGLDRENKLLRME